jgi:DNA invertase Pin-like site-specific DNA recombinase
VFREKASGARGDRAELAKVLRRLEPGDVLVVTRLDRLARSTRDLLNVLASATERGAGFRSLKDAWADTTTPHGRLMLAVLGGLAEFERELIRGRTGEGRERAKTAGVRFGRPLKMTAHQRREALQRMDAGESVADLAQPRCSLVPLRQSLQQPRNLHCVPMPAPRRRRDTARVERCGDVVQFRYPGSPQLRDDRS